MTKARIGDADFLASAAEKAILREAKSGNPLAIQKLLQWCSTSTPNRTVTYSVTPVRGNLHSFA